MAPAINTPYDFFFSIMMISSFNFFFIISICSVGYVRIQCIEKVPIAACVVGGVSFTGGIGKISGVVVGVLIFTALTYSLTILGIDTNLQFVFSGIIILVAVTLDCLKYVQKK